MMFEKAESGSAWYHHFWVWFIVALLGGSVIASLTSVAIAYRHRDVDVRIRERLEAAGGSRPAILPGSSDEAFRTDGP